MAEGGIIRFFQNLDIGGPVHLAGFIEREYTLSNFDTSFAQLDQELRSQRGAELTMLYAMAAAPLIDTAIYGRALSPNDMYNPNSRLDNIEQEGWSIKGPQSYIESPEVAENPDGVACTEDVGKIITDIKYKPSSGAIFKADPNKTTTILGNYDKDMSKIINEMGNVKSTYSGAKKGGFNVLNVPDDIFKTRTPQQFWDEINQPWLDEVIKRGDDIVMATKPEGAIMQSFNNLTGEWGPSGLAREYQYLCDKGYHYDSTTNMMIK